MYLYVNYNITFTMISLILTLSAAFCISMPLRMDTLAIIHRNTKLSELYSMLVEAACRSLKLLESVLLEQLGKSLILVN